MGITILIRVQELWRFCRVPGFGILVILHPVRKKLEQEFMFFFFLFCIVCTYVGKKILLLGTTKIFLLGTTNIDPPCLNRAPGLNRVSEPHCLNRGALAKLGCPV